MIDLNMKKRKLVLNSTKKNIDSASSVAPKTTVKNSVENITYPVKTGKDGKEMTQIIKDQKWKPENKK